MCFTRPTLALSVSITAALHAGLTRLCPQSFACLSLSRIPSPVSYLDESSKPCGHVVRERSPIDGTTFWFCPLAIYAASAMLTLPSPFPSTREKSVRAAQVCIHHACIRRCRVDDTGRHCRIEPDGRRHSPMNYPSSHAHLSCLSAPCRLFFLSPARSSLPLPLTSRIKSATHHRTYPFSPSSSAGLDSCWFLLGRFIHVSPIASCFNFVAVLVCNLLGK